MKIVVASDEKTPLTDITIEYLKKQGKEIIPCGALVEKNDKWAEIGRDAAELVVSGIADQAILFCWSGTGICMAANKVKGARAALCWDGPTAQLARKWDDANILCISLRYTSKAILKEIFEAWFTTKFDEENLNQAHKLDQWPA